MWKDLAHGALGALVIVDTRRLEDCFAAVDFFERMQLPFVVAVNRFGDQLTHTLDDVRWALAIHDDVPVISFDARKFLSVRDALLVVLDEALRKARARRATPATPPAAAPADGAGAAAGGEPVQE
jgi:signal recognition particle receptor subunit beta